MSKEWGLGAHESDLERLLGLVVFSLGWISSEGVFVGPYRAVTNRIGNFFLYFKISVFPILPDTYQSRTVPDTYRDTGTTPLRRIGVSERIIR